MTLVVYFKWRTERASVGSGDSASDEATHSCPKSRKRGQNTKNEFVVEVRTVGLGSVIVSV